MLDFIAKLTMARLPKETAEALVHQAGAGRVDVEERTTVPIFIHPKALTFPVMVALVKGAWLAVALLPLQRTASIWFPFLACLILGLLVAVSNLRQQKTDILGWIFGLVIGLLNSLVIFGAVVGISAARQ